MGQYDQGGPVRPGRTGTGWFLIKEGPPNPLSPLINNERR
jgi:hypothetical protein